MKGVSWDLPLRIWTLCDVGCKRAREVAPFCQRVSDRLDARLYCRPKRWILVFESTPLYHECSKRGRRRGSWAWHLLTIDIHSLLLSLLSDALVERAWSVSSCVTWTATARRTCTWAARLHRHARRSRGHQSAHGAATTACCPGSKATNDTAVSRTARVTSASWSLSVSASWRRKLRSGGSRPTKVWRV